ncbi:putative aminoadipate reductase [Laetiporus sulphureus 93-53]|uniref:Putative aminoadipate reductase n=1 Tax=Laetiporus sulphureus 93-53 TaxID=1314785 RepID=A0A165DW50_9APHY|nr:putative aminoadipate reductase [Laetiporus sulphureus 93-53]KZT05750.1 putative aminoadipate reductase [Laetiporus sulphureus 93-53]
MATVDIPLSPPLDGSIPVLPGFLDFHAQHNPTRPMYHLISEDEKLSNTTISFQQFAYATHRVARLFHSIHSTPGRPVVALLINCDTVLYHALLVGLVRAGLVPFPIMPRNSAPAVLNMLERIGCHHVIFQPTFAHLVDAVRSSNTEYQVHVHDLPDITDIFPELVNSSVTEVPEAYTMPAPPSPSDVLFYLHSSGSTGFPKPIPQTRNTLLSWSRSSSLVDARDRGLHFGPMALPAFHTLGVIIQLCAPLVSGQYAALFFPRAHRSLPPLVPTPENTVAAARRARIDVLVFVPTFLEALARDDKSVQYLASLPAVCFSGGPLADATGATLVSAGVNLYPIYGGTEFGAPVRIFDFDDDPNNTCAVKSKARIDWKYMQIVKECNPRWVPQGNGTYELQFLSCPGHQLGVENLPNGEHGYATSDLWEPHPSKPGLWRIVGRKDDLIILSEKVTVEQEYSIGSSPLVQGALMFGRGRAQIGLLVEPQPNVAISPQDESVLAQFRNALWPDVEKANRVMPAFARIYKEMILVTDASRPLVRAGKGTVIRAPSLALYEKEINALYEAVEQSSSSDAAHPPPSWKGSDLTSWLIDQATLLNDHRSIDKSRDLFEQGFDSCFSLSATFLRNKIIGALRASPDPAASSAALEIHSDFVFSHPTVGELADAISKLVHPEESTSMHTQSPEEQIATLVEKYTASLPPAPKFDNVDRSRHAVVMITGTTGNVGANVLAQALANERVSRVVAVNRGSSLLERHRKTFAAAKVPLELLSNRKLVLLGVDFDRDDLGLEEAVLQELRSSVTHVVHSAWRVDFNLKLSSFESNISAVVRLMTALPRAHLIFTSSISAVQSWNMAERGPIVPERPIEDSAVAAGTGYGMSKYVVEQILSKANSAGWRTTVVRIGQVCGSADTGTWNTAEWVPILVKSSMALESFPAMDGAVSWIPISALASSIMDLVMAEHPPELINLAHPRPIPSHDVFHAIAVALGIDLPVISMERWIAKLEDSAKDSSIKGLSDIPAIKLLDFFRTRAVQTKEAQDAGVETVEMGGLPLMATSEAVRACPTLKDLEPLSQKHASAWVRFWRSEGFIA